MSGDILRLSAQRHPLKTALVHEARRVLYGELDADSNRFARAILSAGLEKGECVAVMCPNVPDYATVHFGTSRTGSLLVNLSVMFGPEELVHILNRTRARLLIVSAECLASIEAVQGKLRHLERVVVIGGAAGGPHETLEDFIAPHPATPPAVVLADTDPLGMSFTGGTTGLPKGAVVSHRARYVSAFTTLIEHELTGNDVIAAVTPLYHAVGLLIWFQAVMLAGATCVLLGRWDPARFVAAVARERISAALLVPVQLAAILDPPHFEPEMLSSLEKLGCAGATASAALIARARRQLPRVRLVDHYGQSETGPLATLKPWDPPEKFGTIGRSALGVDLRIVDPGGNPVAQGEVGEIAVRGEFMFEGYFENEAETRAYFRGGDEWGWTGDLASIDADGYITLAGRSKDMIVSGGINIYPREVERVLEQHEAVAECTVFGIPDSEWGEALAAYVVASDGVNATPEQLIAYCGERLARYKRPKSLHLVSAIPKTPTGKIQKPALREAYLAGDIPG